ncbi:hypothetical protein cyc_01003 [Cyclospora cayetanensis]|uniref:Uncharacterized protein n=1 Tax=Cyclospora cayetanensis TaxID=88456 RepID=A0A1D3CWG9_9EIME|nr:hypothetical protein cyc_01003 [Cyclospora cayetanensis]
MKDNLPSQDEGGTYWESYWRPSWWGNSFPYRGRHMRSQGCLESSVGDSKSLECAALLSTRIAEHASTIGVAGNTCCDPVGWQQGSGSPLHAGSQNKALGIRCKDISSKAQKAEQFLPWALPGGGFNRMGARPQMQQQDNISRDKFGRHKNAKPRGVPVSAATASVVTAPAPIAPYPTTDVPWVVAAPAYHQLCSLKGKSTVYHSGVAALGGGFRISVFEFSGCASEKQREWSIRSRSLLKMEESRLPSRLQLHVHHGAGGLQQNSALLHSVEPLEASLVGAMSSRQCPPGKQRAVDRSFLVAAAVTTPAEAAAHVRAAIPKAAARPRKRNRDEEVIERHSDRKDSRFSSDAQQRNATPSRSPRFQTEKSSRQALHLVHPGKST